MAALRAYSHENGIVGHKHGWQRRGRASAERWASCGHPPLHPSKPPIGGRSPRPPSLPTKPHTAWIPYLGLETRHERSQPTPLAIGKAPNRMVEAHGWVVCAHCVPKYARSLAPTYPGLEGLERTDGAAAGRSGCGNMMQIDCEQRGHGRGGARSQGCKQSCTNTVALRTIASLTQELSGTLPCRYLQHKKGPGTHIQQINAA